MTAPLELDPVLELEVLELEVLVEVEELVEVELLVEAEVEPLVEAEVELLVEVEPPVDAELLVDVEPPELPAAVELDVDDVPPQSHDDHIPLGPHCWPPWQAPGPTQARVDP
jgi:hypothetical protein